MIAGRHTDKDMLLAVLRTHIPGAGNSSFCLLASFKLQVIENDGPMPVYRGDITAIALPSAVVIASAFQ